jgi:hypothetical protein
MVRRTGDKKSCYHGNQERRWQKDFSDYMMGHKLGEDVMGSSAFQDQVVGEEVTKEVFWRSCEVERSDEKVVSGHMGRMLGMTSVLSYPTSVPTIPA